jgi:carbon storage regulator
LLILGRRINQSIVFPNCGITVRVLDVNGRVAKIGIEAPQSVEIMRGELVTSARGRGAESASGFEYSLATEQLDAPDPDLPVMQFAQRLAEIRAGLHLFQQRRAAGDESGADQVFGDLLNELALLDTDSLRSQRSADPRLATKNTEFVSEKTSLYGVGRQADAPIHVLVVNEPENQSGFHLPVGTFHGCQMCTVNNRETALQSIAGNERFDFIVCNGSPMAFDELELVRTIRSDRRMESTKVFVTSVSQNAKEHLELSRSYRIDGWLARPLLPHDLWKHIVESQQIEI